MKFALLFAAVFVFVSVSAAQPPAATFGSLNRLPTTRRPPTFKSFASNRVTSSDQAANVLRYVNEANPDGSYRYDIQIDNSIAVQAQGAPRDFGGNPPVAPVVSQGSFSWISPENVHICITYIADENGYQPSFVRFGLSPLGCTPSPHRLTPSPHRLTPSPHRLTPSPHRLTPSPHMLTPSPHRLTPSPHRLTPSPHRLTPSPHRLTPSPHRLTPSPQRLTPPSRRPNMDSIRVGDDAGAGGAIDVGPVASDIGASITRNLPVGPPSVLNVSKNGDRYALYLVKLPETNSVPKQLFFMPTKGALKPLDVKSIGSAKKLP